MTAGLVDQTILPPAPAKRRRRLTLPVVLLGESHAYASDFPAGYGFSGIAIALLGRNHPIGIAIGALLWSFLEQSSQILDLEGVPKEIVTIMQGVTVLSVVIAYELVRRFSLAQQQRRVGAELRAQRAARSSAPTRRCC